MANHGVFRAAINGIHTRGVGGFVYVAGDECCYMFPSELKGCPDAATTLTEMLEDADTASRVLYVLENRDGHLHVLAYPKEVVCKALVTESAVDVTEDQSAVDATEEDA